MAEELKACFGMSTGVKRKKTGIDGPCLGGPDPEGSFFMDIALSLT